MPGTTPAKLPDLAPIVAEYREKLGLRDWQITAEYAELDCLARVVCTPTRKIATIQVSTTCPPGELRASVRHELLHALVSPLTHGIPSSPESVMLEEHVVEALTLALDRAAPAHRAPPPLPQPRARTSAAVVRSRGGSMDPKKIKDAIAAIKEGNGDAALAMLEELIASLAGAEAAEPPADAAAEAAAGAPAMRAAAVLPPEVAAELARFRTAEATRAAADAKARAIAETAERSEVLIGAIKARKFTRAELFDGDAPAEPYASTSIASLRTMMARKVAAPASTRFRPNLDEVSGDLAARARASGMTVEERERAEKNVARGMTEER